MMKRPIFLFILLTTIIFQAMAQNVSFVANADKVVISGQQFRVIYTLSTGGEKGKDIRGFDDTENIKLLFGPIFQSENTSIGYVQGNRSSSYSATYISTLMINKEGTYTIPPATIKVGNSEYKSNSLEIEVLPQDQAQQASSKNQSSNTSRSQQNQSAGQGQNQGGVSSEDIFIRAEVSKRSVYENEGFLLTFKLYSLVNIVDFENIKYPELEGFISQEVELPPNRQLSLENYNGRNYRTLVLKQTILFPQRAGTITIEPGKFEPVVQVRSKQQIRSIFDEIFDAYQNVKLTRNTSPVNIEVKPLPAGKPASFNGAVGDYKITSSISTNRMKANDAVTVGLTISGTGNLNYLKNPEVKFPNDFDPFDPEIKTNTKVSAGGVNGTRSIQYNAIPRYAGKFTIPAIGFSFFDPKSGSYKTLSSEEYTLEVEPGEGGSGIAPVVNATNKEDIRFLGQDIRHIKTSGYDFHKSGFIYGTWKYLAFYILPFLFFIIFFCIYRKQAVENSNIALVRTKKANKVASKRLKIAAKYLKEGKKEEFYDEMLKAVWGYLSDKLSIPVSSLTKDNVEANLSQYGTSEELITEFMNILNTAEFARFAPSQGSGTMDELYNSTVRAIDNMETNLKKI